VLHPGVASALAHADLPSLETLALRGVHYFPLDLAELSSTLAGLRAKRFFLGIRGNDTRGLAPIADRIEGLSLASLPARWDLSLPRLSRLALTIPQEEAAGPRPDLGALPSAPELLLTVEAGRETLTSMGEALAASELVKNLRALHLVCKKPLAPFGQAPLENLEELSLPEGSLMAVEAALPLFARDVFPAVKTLTLGDDRLLGDVARSPLAARIEILALAIPNFRVARMWCDVRASFPKLKTLVVRAWNFLRPVERAMVIEGDHEIVWAEHHVWASRRFFGAPGGDPGFVMRA